MVSRSVDDKLLHVEGDFDGIKNSVEETKLPLKEIKDFIHDKEDKK